MESVPTGKPFHRLSVFFRLFVVFIIIGPFSLIYLAVCIPFLPFRGLRIRIGNLYGKAVGGLICTIAGIRPGPQPLAYAASKASVANLTKTLAGALGPEIRVNAVAPGWLEGEWMERMLGDNYEGLMERRAKYTPLKRVATASDVGDVMLNLADHNTFVSGEIITIDGGFSSTT